MNKDLPIYEVVLDEASGADGIEAISLVQSPAMEKFAEFIMLSEQAQYLELVEAKEKDTFLAAVLIPNKPIYRNDNGREFYIMFSKETIKASNELYMKNGRQNNSTLEHTDKMLDGITMTETWIKEDMINDKSAKYGLSAPVGSWIAMLKTTNPEIKQMAKEGKIRGYSIEGNFIPVLRENLSKEKSILDKIIEILKEYE